MFTHLWQGNFGLDRGVDITASTNAGRIVINNFDNQVAPLYEFDLNGNFLSLNSFFANQGVTVQSMDFDEATGDLYFAVGDGLGRGAPYGIWRRSKSGVYTHLWQGNFGLDRGVDITASTNAGRIVINNFDNQVAPLYEFDLNGNFLSLNSFFANQGVTVQSMDFDEATGDLYFAAGDGLGRGAPYGLWRQNKNGLYTHLWQGNFGLDRGVDITAFSTVTAVPEPSSLCIFGVGMFLLIISFGRRTR